MTATVAVAPSLLQHAHRHLAVDLVVVHEQQPQRGELFGRRRERRRLRLLPGPPQRAAQHAGERRLAQRSREPRLDRAALAPISAAASSHGRERREHEHHAPRGARQRAAAGARSRGRSMPGQPVVEQDDVERGPPPRPATRAMAVLAARTTSGRAPQAHSVACRMRRLTAWSSTTSTRAPARSQARSTGGLPRPPAASGSSTQNSLPWPGSLATWIEPPISSRQLPADGQPQARAAVLARRGAVGLREALEHRAQALGRDADAGVAHARA